jgi:hypothetical protein
MTLARETFLKQRQEPGRGARWSLKAVTQPILEPSVKETRRIGPWPVDNFARCVSGREWIPVSQH